MASIDPATWTPWNLANLIWLHGRALYFHHIYLSGAAENLPSQLQQMHTRTTSLSLALLKLGEVMREKRLRVLDTDHKSTREILQMVELVTVALRSFMETISSESYLKQQSGIQFSHTLASPLHWMTGRQRRNA